MESKQRSQGSQVWGKRPGEVPLFQLLGWVPGGQGRTGPGTCCPLALALAYPASGSLRVGIEEEENLPPQNMSL